MSTRHRKLVAFLHRRSASVALAFLLPRCLTTASCCTGCTATPSFWQRRTYGKARWAPLLPAPGGAPNFGSSKSGVTGADRLLTHSPPCPTPLQAYRGSGMRLRAVAARLLAGAPLHVAVVGGSISYGKFAPPGTDYGARLFAWLNTTLPAPPPHVHRFTNAAKPAHTSATFALCPDLIPQVGQRGAGGGGILADWWCMPVSQDSCVPTAELVSVVFPAVALHCPASRSPQHFAGR